MGETPTTTTPIIPTPPQPTAAALKAKPSAPTSATAKEEENQLSVPTEVPQKTTTTVEGEAVPTADPTGTAPIPGEAPAGRGIGPTETSPKLRILCQPRPHFQPQCLPSTRQYAQLVLFQ